MAEGTTASGVDQVSEYGQIKELLDKPLVDGETWYIQHSVQGFLVISYHHSI